MPAANDVVLLDTRRGRTEVHLSRELGAGLAELAEDEANRWIKSLRVLTVDGRPLRDRFSYRGDSLWWFAELYLHKMQVVRSVLRTILALEAVVAREAPRAIAVPGGDALTNLVARELARQHGIRFSGRVASRSRGLEAVRLIARAHVFEWRASMAARRAEGRSVVRQSRIAAFVHTAFWKRDEEQYIGPVLDCLASARSPEELTIIGVGPHTSYRARTWRHRVSDLRGTSAGAVPITPIDWCAGPGALRLSRQVWDSRASMRRALCASPAIRDAAVIRGCDVWPLLEPQFIGIAYLQFPWSAYVMDQIGTVLDQVRPDVALTYAEAGGWGRALVLEARRRGIATVGLQHGFIYRHWLNYLHEPDEMRPSPLNPSDRGYPRPTLTLVYDRLAAGHLAQQARYPSDAVSVTGSPRLDALAREARRFTESDDAALKARLGASSRAHLVVVAAKFTQISSVFGELVQAVLDLPDVHLVIRCHPAEGPDPYVEQVAGGARVSIAPADVSMAALMHAARLIVTVNSTAAIEGLALGIPSMVIGLPSNLSPLVEAGVMFGVPEGQAIRPILESALSDDAIRTDMAGRAAAFVSDFQITSDGRAAARAAERVLALARSAGTGSVVS
ncbi:MAG: hypothetical protein AB1806_21485 [Acidobacteriota bacterium]